MKTPAVPFSLRRGCASDAASILAVHQSAVLGSAAAFYGRDVLNEWAPVNITPEHVTEFERSIKEGKEIFVVAVNPADVVLGFGSIVPKTSGLFVKQSFELRELGLLSARTRPAGEAKLTAVLT